MTQSKAKIEVSHFDRSVKNREALLFTLRNSSGLEASVTNFGGIIQSIKVPDRNGVPSDVVLGFNSIEDYLKENIYAGATVGRIAGRLSNGMFSIGNKGYRVIQNEGTNHLHGGVSAMDKQIWNHEVIHRNGVEMLKLSYFSPHKEEGYPGNVGISTFYSLTEQNGIKIEFEAMTDQPTPLCLTNHSYFNLAGEGNEDITNHELWIAASGYHETDDHLSFLGRRKSVDGANDFRTSQLLSARVQALKQSHGDMYLNENKGQFNKVAEVTEGSSGRVMEVFTTQTCTQFYTGKYLNTRAAGKSGRPYTAFSGLCLECQGFPDSPNHEGFASIILHPNEIYQETTEYRFSVRS